MTSEERINQRYFIWLCNNITDARHKSRYQKLLWFLHQSSFTYTHPMDSNRYEDGINLRYAFGYEYGIDDVVIATAIDNLDCSILEMMVALARRIEIHIMDDPAKGNRTSVWFWTMVDNLGLRNMDNSHIDISTVKQILARFVDRKYKRNGKGGLFSVQRRDLDMREIDIWYQAMAFLNEYDK